MALPITATPKLDMKDTIILVNLLWKEGDEKELVSCNHSIKEVREKKHTIRRY